MQIEWLDKKFFCDYKDFLLNQNIDLAKKVWDKNSKLISSHQKTQSSSQDAYNFWIFVLTLINSNIEKYLSDLTEEEVIDFYSSIICDGKPDYSFDAIYIPESWNIQIYDFKSWKQWLDFTDIETFKNFFISHIEEWKRTDPGNPILKKLLDELDEKITNENIECDIYIVREKEIEFYDNFINQLKELRWKTKRIKIWTINIVDWKKINEIIKDNLILISEYNKSQYKLWFEKMISLDDGSNIITTSLFNLLEFYLQTKKNNYDVFKLNVRKYKENNVIRWDLIHTVENFPEKFFRFHNWINLTYEKLEVDQWLLTFKYPQIINGCQTLSVLQWRFLKYVKAFLNISDNKDYNQEIDLLDVVMNIEKLKKAKILIKSHNIPLLDPEIDKIAEYSNNQNPIDKQNLRSNDLVQIILEQFIARKGYKYIRKEWDSKPEKYIEIDTLFQLIHCCIFELPNLSKDRKKDIFTLDEWKNSYISILNKLDLDTVATIVDYYFKYIDFKKKRESDEKISDYYDHHIILWIYYIYINNWSLDKDINLDFQLIYDLINESIIELWHPRWITSFWYKNHLLQKRWKNLWDILKIKLFDNFELCILEDIYNTTELEKYRLERLKEKRINPDSRIWSMSSILKKVVRNNNDIPKEDLFLIIKKFYSFFWPKHIQKDKFLEEFNSCIWKYFNEKNTNISIKK